MQNLADFVFAKYTQDLGQTLHAVCNYKHRLYICCHFCTASQKLLCRYNALATLHEDGEEEDEKTASAVSHAPTEDEGLGPSMEEIDAAVREVSMNTCTTSYLSAYHPMQTHHGFWVCFEQLQLSTHDLLHLAPGYSEPLCALVDYV